MRPQANAATGQIEAHARGGIEMESDFDSRMDRYMNRQLHPAAARALAHEALDDSNLFDELTAVALVRAALESPATTDRALAQAALDDENLFDTLVARGAVEAAARAPRTRPDLTWVIAGVAAIAAGLLTFVILRPSSHPVQQPVQQARSIVAKPIAASAILLTSDLQPAPSHDALVFRGPGGATRVPKSEGEIVSLEDGVATVNLGSIDGLEKGTQLQPGRIVVTTVFRDHARGTISANAAMHAGDPVRVPSSAHLGAIRQQVDALAANGNLPAARDLARSALVSGTPGETRPLLERLAAIEYQTGARDVARERYEVAVNNFAQPPAASSMERASTLASYGALCLLSGDLDRTNDLLQKALAQSPAPALKAGILNNLGAVAEARADLGKAAGYYQQALVQIPSKSERAVIEANLARVNSSKLP
jgi:tetratricopeptide (TPR) repeat protein